MDLTAEAFDRLLDWLGPERESAARRYEQIRSRLIRIFTARGCMVPEELADETIDRVAAKLRQIVETYVGDPALYFYGVGDNVYREHIKKKTTFEVHISKPTDDEVELLHQCLEGCMERLSESNRELIIAYYDGESDKIDARKVLAQRLGLGANALWIRTHRIRESLRKCVSACRSRTGARVEKSWLKEANERHTKQ